MAMFETVLVANRGEIAVRVMRTLRRLGIRSVAVYTDPDRDALHVRTADEAVGIGPADAYLDVARVLDAAQASGAQALHPGYGFLSENPALARGCARLGITFVGPPPEAIELMGDKINAKRTVEAAGVPVVPGRNQAGLTDEELGAAALDIGLPVLFKPSAGGGGKGMRMVTDPADIGPAIAAARREALGAFGDDTLLVERFVQNPRHIEVQVFADTHGHVVGLGERECSLQRRHQKIIEEAPSPLLDDVTRAAMSASAVEAARSCGYVGAGTVEFIVPGDRADHYFFMEMNTRLQVEHPVTEEVLGLDLVEWQLRVAAGEPLPWADQDAVPRPKGHAVEARIYAEDPQRGFLPSSGPVLALRQPDRRPYIRVDSALQRGTVVGTDYDPMLAKVIAWGDDRPEALARLQGALADTAIIGVTTNVGFLRRLIEYPDVAAGRIDTGLVERIAEDLHPDPAPVPVLAAAALLDGALDEPDGPAADPWDVRDGWRPAGPAPRRSSWSIAGRVVEVAVDGSAGTVTVGSGPPRPGRAVLSRRGRVLIDHSGTTGFYDWSRQGERMWLSRGGDTWALTLERETIDHTGPARAADGPVASPMPGTVLAVHVKAGDDVSPGQPLVSVEAMKMEHVVTAAAAGRIRQVLVRPGDSVRLDQPLAFVDPEEESEKA
jgi:acetyl-CoA/propionyl-CoA carboxylase, biotin carboxylase, biotin carboxyl carrier protein